LTTLYLTYTSATSSALSHSAEPPRQCADFVQWQREWLQSEEAQAHLAYWQQQLEDAPPVLQIPTDHPRPATQSFRADHYPFHLSRKLTDALEALSEQAGVTLRVMLLAAVNALLLRHTGQSDLVVGTPISCRGRAEHAQVIGPIASTLA